MRSRIDLRLHRSAFAALGLVARVAVSCALALTACRDTTPAWRPPNIVLISLDTLRADRLSVYGHTSATTPQLQRLAERAVVFDRAYTHAPHTLAAHTSLLTGLTPGRHGVLYRGNSLAQQEVTLAELLTQRGYRSTAIVNAFYLAPEFRLDRGFEAYDYAHDIDVGRDAAANNALILEQLAEPSDRPFFLFAHYFDAHSDLDGPYDAPPEYLERFAGETPPDYRLDRGHFASRQMLALNHQGMQLRASEREHLARLYDAGVAHLDARVGALLDALDASGRLEDTIVVVTSDHGEEFQDHGKLLHAQVYEELVRVPLIVSMPEMRGATTATCHPDASSRDRPRAGRSDGLVQLADVFATLVDCVGLELPERAQGTSFLRQLAGKSGTREWAYFESAQGRQQGISSGRWKLVESLDRPAQLFDLEADPGERSDVSAEHPEVARELAQELARYQHENSLSRSPRTDFEVPLEVEKALEALGYADRPSAD